MMMNDDEYDNDNDNNDNDNDNKDYGPVCPCLIAILDLSEKKKSF